MTTREVFDALSPERQRAVVAVFRAELARGWIPKESEIRAVIDEVCLH
ncbi:hypothetical protein [Nocardioides sp.]|nr:hypothetical protein [Nocardioides sp.]